MNKTLKRALYGAVYVAIMWFGTSYSEFTFRLLFAILGLLSLYEMYILRKGKSKDNVELQKSNVLLLGPTGSGKTTTLYSTLNKMDQPDVNIVTIEDPIEFDLDLSLIHI